MGHMERFCNWLLSNPEGIDCPRWQTYLLVILVVLCFVLIVLSLSLALYIAGISAS